VTRVAFDERTPDWMRHRILCILKGVGHPVASAILTVRYPETHTVIDKRVVGAFRKLRKLGLLGVKPPSDTNHYWDYLDRVFRPAARRLGVCHRDLDRALWKWHKEGMPTTWPTPTLETSGVGPGGQDIGSTGANVMPSTPMG
jgi:hypothetical protein